MKKDLVIGIGVGIPVIIIMILIGGGGHTSLDFENEQAIIEEPKQVEETEPTEFSKYCEGFELCITGFVTKIVDGHTIHVDGQSVRFALVTAPKSIGEESRNFIQTICPVGTEVLIDEESRRIVDVNFNIIGVVYCNGMNLSQELLDSGLGNFEKRFCNSSKFAGDSWALKYGC